MSGRDEMIESLAKDLFLIDYPKDKWERFKPDDWAPNHYRAVASAALAKAIEKMELGE
jgi:hypothetical protein